MWGRASWRSYYWSTDEFEAGCSMKLKRAGFFCGGRLAGNIWHAGWCNLCGLVCVGSGNDRFEEGEVGQFRLGWVVADLFEKRFCFRLAFRCTQAKCNFEVVSE